MKEGKENYQQSKREGRPDAFHLQKKENNIRRSHHKIIFNTSVPYGNSETKRKRRKEDRKYINYLADYYGAIIRTLGADKFQFPPPMKTYTDKGKVKWVYPGNAQIPEFAPQHTAAELDFVDMIRPHGLELIRQCLKYSVPMRDARRFLDEIVIRLTPFLEQVYTGQRKIEYGFVRGSAKVLREVVEVIRARYGGTNGHPQSITKEVSQSLRESRSMFLIDSNFKDNLDSSDIRIIEEIYNSNSKYPLLDSFFADLANSCDVTTSSDWKERVKELRMLIKKKILGRDDTRYIWKDLLELSRKLGVSFHDFVSNSEFTTRPFSLTSVFRYGDEIATEKTEFLIVCEVPVADGRGRVDIILFRRKELYRIDDAHVEYVWEPCMIVEVKTRCFFNLDIYATFTKSKDRNRRVLEHIKELRRSEEDEWKQVIDATPIDYEQEQLDAYEREIIQSYSKYARRDVHPPKGLTKGVLVVDLKENWELLRDNIKELLLEAYHRSEGATLSKREHLHIKPEVKDLRIGLVLFSDSERKEATPVKKVGYLDPFHYSRKRDDDREFILYLTVSGKGSPAQSAAQIAARWHGLELLHERAKGSHRDVLWIDLSGNLSTQKKRRRIFRTVLQSSSVKRFLRRRINFIDLSGSVSDYLQGTTALTQVRNDIQTSLKDARRPVIVVTGFDRVRSSTRRERVPLLDRLLTQFLYDTPEHSTVLWFDRPVPTTRTSERYDTRSIAPFYRDSPWMNAVDEIIYSIPTAPRRYGSYVPVEDDQRWLVTEKNDDFTVAPILVPPLYKWGERFRSDSAREENIISQNTFYLRSSSYTSQRSGTHIEWDEDAEEALIELVPHLERFYKEESGDSKAEEEERIKRTVLSTVPSSPQPFLSRVRYTPYQYLTEKKRDGRVTRIEPLARINHRREYRKSRLYGAPRKVTTHPPHVALLRYNKRNIVSSAREELRGIRSVLKIIRKRHGEEQEWKELIDSLGRLVDSRNRPVDVFNVLRSVKMVLESHPMSKKIRSQLRSNRTKISSGLTPEQELVLKRMTAQHPDLLSIIGNQFFLILLAALDEAKVLEPSMKVLEKLWQYLVPWQLMSLGFEPEYPAQHQTGMSVLDRSILINRLARRAGSLQEQYKSKDIYGVQFGKTVIIRDNKKNPSLLLSFQTGPESHEINTIFIGLPSDTEGNLTEILRSLCRERSFWGETDLTRLGTLSDMVDLDNCTDIMVATQGGVRGLWVLDSKKKVWTAIGSMEYYSRPREQVTLLMSVTLREERELLDVSTQSVKIPGSFLQNMVEVGLGTISAVFRKCKSVRCRVSLDTIEKMFRLSFLGVENDNEFAHLLLKRTVDVLEILRRPDFQCQQVVIDEHEMIWNRFRDIKYAGDAMLLRPWVERREPFKTVELKIPATADQFLLMHKERGLRLEVRHDRMTCPLCAVSQDVLKERIQKHAGKISEYIQSIEGAQSQPDYVLEESMYGHGMCWRVELEGKEELPETVRELENIALSGPALATFLKTGSLVYMRDGQWVNHELDVPQATSLPREFRESIVLVEAYRELVPQALKEMQVPGSYLVKREEQWIVSPVFLQKRAVVWDARSDTTGETYKGQSFTVLLNPGASLEHTTDSVISSIVKNLPGDCNIRDFEALTEHIGDMLRLEGYRSRNLFGVSVEGEGDRVTFVVTKRGPDINPNEYGAVRVSEGMSLDDVFERLNTSIDLKVTAEEYELECRDELRESLSEVLQKISIEQGWTPPEEDLVKPPLDILTVGLEHGRVVREVKERRLKGMSQQVLGVIDGFLEKVQPALQANPALISSFIDVLLLKVDVVVSGEIDDVIDPVMLLNVLDQIEKYSYHFEPQVLKSNIRFAKQVRWALALRESLREKNDID
ncbi:MAG: hypothetical protein RTU63_02565 [Candidatus Thorarchaeota archaeon]